MSSYGFYRPLPRTLKEALETLTSDQLREYAKLLSRNTGTRKDQRIQVIVRALEGNGLRDVWQKLSKTEQLAVAEVVHSEQHSLDTAFFTTKYGEEAPPVRTRWDYYGYKKPYTVYQVLMPEGLMPQDIKERLRGFVPKPPPAQLKLAEGTPQAVSAKGGTTVPLRLMETEEAAMHDVVAVLRLIDMGKVAISAKTQMVSLAGVRAVAGVLQQGELVPMEKVGRATDAIRAFAWPLVARAAGWAEASGTRLVLTDNGREALHTSPHALLREAWESWVVNGQITELERVSDALISSYVGSSIAIDEERRDTVCDTLAQCPVGQWVGAADFVRYFISSGRSIAPKDLGTDYYPSYSYSSYSSYAYPGAGGGTWHLLANRYILCLLAEYAATLGLIDIAWADNVSLHLEEYGLHQSSDRYDGLSAFRLTPLGAYALGLTLEYEPPAHIGKPTLKVLPNREVVATDREHFHAGDRLYLDRIAAKAGEFTWKLDREKMLAAAEEGMDLGKVAEFLSTRSETPLADNVLQFLSETATRSGMVREEGPAVVFRIGDPAAATLIMHDPTIARHCAVVGADSVAVPEDKVSAFRRALRKLGYAAPRQPGDRV